MLVHMLAFFAVVVSDWVMAPHNTPKPVFTEFYNSGGWYSMGFSLMVVQISAIYSVLGSDATAHMAEEVRDAGRYVPVSIFWPYIGNGLIAIVFLVYYLFTIYGVEVTIDDPCGYPFLYIFQIRLQSRGRQWPSHHRVPYR